MFKFTFSVVMFAVILCLVGCTAQPDKDKKKEADSGSDPAAIQKQIDEAKAAHAAKMTDLAKQLEEAKAKAKAEGVEPKGTEPKVEPKGTEPKGTDPKVEPKGKSETKEDRVTIVTQATFLSGGFEVMDGPHKGKKLSISKDQIETPVFFGGQGYQVRFKKLDNTGNFTVTVKTARDPAGYIDTEAVEAGGYVTLEWRNKEEMKAPPAKK